MKIEIEVVKNDLLELKADVCVCSIHRSKNLQRGPLAKQVSIAAGDKLQLELDSRNNGRELQHGQVVQASAGDLSSNFKRLHFVCLLSWQEGNEKDLQQAVDYILQKAAKRNYQSIVIPPLGAGGQSYPPSKVAVAILQAIYAFDLDHPNSSITSIKIALFDQEEEMLLAFADIIVQGVKNYDNCEQGKTPSSPNGSSFFMFQKTTSLLERARQLIGFSPTTYRFMIGTVPVGITPRFSSEVTKKGFCLNIGFRISIDIFPVYLQNILAKIV